MYSFGIGFRVEEKEGKEGSGFREREVGFRVSGVSIGLRVFEALKPEDALHCCSCGFTELTREIYRF